MGAGQQYGINIGGLCEQLIEVLLYKIICTGIFIFAILHEGHPHRAGKLVYAHIGEEFIDLDLVRA
jgi:hypothetical protein